MTSDYKHMTDTPSGKALPLADLTHYRSFLLRLWQEGQAAPWRASIQDVITGERRRFADLESLCEFLNSIAMNQFE